MSGTPPSMLPVKLLEPLYVRRLRIRLRNEVESRRAVERECFRLRTEVARLTQKLRRYAKA